MISKILCSIYGCLIFLVLIISVSYAQQGQATRNCKDWRQVQMNGFSLCVPKSLKAERKQGVDSEYWTYSDENNEVYIYTHYFAPEPGIEKKYPTFKEEYLWIDKKYARKWSYEDDKANLKFFAGVRIYRDDNPKGKAITIILHSKEPEFKAIAERIFGSVRFQHSK